MPPPLLFMPPSPRPCPCPLRRKPIKQYVTDVLPAFPAAWSGHGDQVQSMSWRGDGTCLATTCRDTQLRLLDPRADKLCGSTQAHAGSRDSWVTWLGASDQLVTTGFDQVGRLVWGEVGEECGLGRVWVKAKG